jgi:hypothetical protein
LFDGDLNLSADETHAFAIWILKTWLLTAHPDAVVSDPGWPPSLWDLDSIPDDIYGWTVNRLPPPDGLSLWMTRRTASLRIEGRPGMRVPLPTIVADGKSTKFHSFTRGIRFLKAGFLDFDLVYHPGWAVEHPLATQGRATQLWPREADVALDLGALPFEDRDHVTWSEGPTLRFAPGAYAALTRPPLSVQTSLLFHPPPPGVQSVFF